MNDKTRNKILLVLFLGVLMGALDIAIVAPALPSIQNFFGIGDRALTWTFTIYVLFNLIGTPLMAKLSDTFGRRSIYIANRLPLTLKPVCCATGWARPSRIRRGRDFPGSQCGNRRYISARETWRRFGADRRGLWSGFPGWPHPGRHYPDDY